MIDLLFYNNFLTTNPFITPNTKAAIANIGTK